MQPDRNSPDSSDPFLYSPSAFQRRDRLRVLGERLSALIQGQYGGLGARYDQQSNSLGVVDCHGNVLWLNLYIIIEFGQFELLEEPIDLRPTISHVAKNLKATGFRFFDRSDDTREAGGLPCYLRGE